MMGNEMENKLLNDLEKLVAEHKKNEAPEIIRWIPICEEYKDATSAFVYSDKGGDRIVRKHGNSVRVLAWIQVSIDPTQGAVCRILKQELPSRESGVNNG